MSETEYKQLEREVLKIRKLVNMWESGGAVYKPAVLVALARILRSARALAGISIGGDSV